MKYCYLIGHCGQYKSLVPPVNSTCTTCDLRWHTPLNFQGQLPLRLNYKLTIGWQCQQEMGEIPNFTDSEWLKTPKTVCVLKVYKDKEFYQLGLQVCIH